MSIEHVIAESEMSPWSHPFGSHFQMALRGKISSWVYLLVLGLGSTHLMSDVTSLKPGKDFTGGNSKKPRYRLHRVERLGFCDCQVLALVHSSLMRMDEWLCKFWGFFSDQQNAERMTGINTIRFLLAQFAQYKYPHMIPLKPCDRSTMRCCC